MKRSVDARAILFDLDDTLYPRRRFVLSGFRAVAVHLDLTEGLDADRVFVTLARASRGPHPGRELQACIGRYGLSQAIVPDLIEIIRAHRPAIRLPLDSRRTLERLRHDWRVGVVTNGLPRVQARKVEALGLRRLVDTIVFANEHGHQQGKPERAPFVAALRRLQVQPSRALFVGDDDHCDLFGAARVGLRTVFFGGYRRGAFEPPRHADAVVDTLSCVSQVAAALLGEQGSRHVA
jgi:putative hydrolase of the HAD superfamily